MRLELTIYVEPKGKARPRVVSKGGKTWAYTPRGTSHLESLIRESILKESKYFDKGIPLKITATFYREKPKSTAKKISLPVTKPDLGNYFALLADSLEKYLYHNDSQITSALLQKRWGAPPRIHLVVEEDK